MSSKAFAAIVLLAVSMGIAPVFADVVINDADEPLQVTFQNDLSSETSEKGHRFSAVLSEDHTYKNQTLPKGTILNGKVSRARASQPFLRPGYLGFEVESAKFPNGAVYTFDTERFADSVHQLNAKKVYHKDGYTPPRAVKSALPFSLVSMADAIPLKYAAGMSAIQILPISLAARMTYGAIAEMSSKKHEQWPTQGRVGYGMLRGTGIPGAIAFVRPSKGAEFHPGDAGKLQLNETWLKGLFSASENLTVLMLEEERQQKEPDAETLHSEMLKQ